jgi:hypothetical protein
MCIQTNEKSFYWLDTGNNRNTVQFILGTLFEEERTFGNKKLEAVDTLKKFY